MESNRRELRFARELRAEGNKTKPVLVGYAAVWNSPSLDLGGFVEVLKPHCFSRCLSQPDTDIRALFSHDTAQVLGRSSAGTLMLDEDNVGLRCTISIPDTTIGRDVYESVKRGDVTGMSFCMRVVDEDLLRNPKGSPAVLRQVNDADIEEISCVAFPAYPATSISARSLWPDGRPEHLEERSLEKRAMTLLNEEILPLTSDEREQLKRRVEVARLPLL